MVSSSRRFIQLGVGTRLAPPLGVHVRPVYQVRFDRFFAEGGAHETFSRWTIDLTHEFPFYRTYRPSSRTTNTPNDCAQEARSSSARSRATNAIRLTPVSEFRPGKLRKIRAFGLLQPHRRRRSVTSPIENRDGCTQHRRIAIGIAPPARRAKLSHL